MTKHVYLFVKNKSFEPVEANNVSHKFIKQAVKYFKQPIGFRPYRQIMRLVPFRLECYEIAAEFKDEYEMLPNQDSDFLQAINKMFRHGRRKALQNYAVTSSRLSLSSPGEIEKIKIVCDVIHKWRLEGHALPDLSKHYKRKNSVPNSQSTLRQDKRFRATENNEHYFHSPSSKPSPLPSSSYEVKECDTSSRVYFIFTFHTRAPSPYFCANVSATPANAKYSFKAWHEELQVRLSKKTCSGKLLFEETYFGCNSYLTQVLHF